jgi:hypothetical protein
LNACVGCGNFTPLVFEKVFTAAAAALFPELELELVELVVVPLDEDEDELLFELLPHPTAKTMTKTMATDAAKPRVPRPISHLS